MILQGLDVASGTKSRITFTFEKVKNEKGSFANPVRINGDGQDIIGTVIPNIYFPMVEKVGQSLGRLAKVATQPDLDFMSSRLRDMGTVYSVTVLGLVKYYNGNGATTSWDMNDFPPKLMVVQNGKKIRVGFQPGNAGEIFLIGHSLEKQLPSIDHWYVSKFGKSQ